MKLRVQAAPPSHFGWLVERTGCQVTQTFRAIEAIDSEGRILGMVGYDNWTENSAQCHMATDSPVAWRALVFENNSPAFSYPFEDAGKGLLLALIRQSNKESIRLTKHFGFRETYRIKDGAAIGDDLVLFEMKKAECPWRWDANRRAA